MVVISMICSSRFSSEVARAARASSAVEQRVVKGELCLVAGVRHSGVEVLDPDRSTQSKILNRPRKQIGPGARGLAHADDAVDLALLLRLPTCLVTCRLGLPEGSPGLLTLYLSGEP